MKTTRRKFVSTLAMSPFLLGLNKFSFASQLSFNDDHLSAFSKKLKPVGRILEMEDWYVWGTSPIKAPNGKTHVFFSRWPASKRMGGWINSCEIAHAVADNPEGPFEYVETVLKPRAGMWDATTCHNPTIKFIDGKYCLFHMGNSNGKTNTKRVGLAIADSLEGPWKRSDKPLLEAGEGEVWDNHCTSNPSVIKHPNGQYWLYYKSWNTLDYENAKNPNIRGNRKYGLAIADKLEGPYIKYEGNPIIDYSELGDNTQLEDAYVWIEEGKFKMIARDMGIYNHEVGLYLESDDGINWSKPQIGYLPVRDYIKEPPGPSHLRKYGRFERPQLLLENDKPTYLFVASQGGKFMNTSAFVFKIG
ncbi:MAG: glycosyl hydrolase family 43 [Thalassobius sp.]|nr:glycosyl hydrolase family 43 [Thalassovita sp.]